jgi:hypothetical protein
MKPLQHAQISAHRYGGNWQDWYALHDWFDQTKKLFPSMQHRLFLHSDFGGYLARQVFGEQLEIGGVGTLPTAEVVRDHQIEDLGRVVPLAEWLNELEDSALCRASEQALRYQSPTEQQLVANPLTVLARRYGGNEDEYQALVTFFDEPGRFAEKDSRSRWVLHNSLGIYLLEEVFGKVLTLSDGRLVSTRSIGEDLVKARLGFIPSAAAVASRVKMRPWMMGAEVREGLRERNSAETLPVSTDTN